MKVRPYVVLTPGALARLVAIVESRTDAADPGSSAWDDAIEARDIARAAIQIERDYRGFWRGAGEVNND